MILTSLASGLYWTYSLTASDPAVREKARGIVRAQIDCAVALGVDAILVVPGAVGRGFWGGDDNVSYADAYKRARRRSVHWRRTPRKRASPSRWKTSGTIS